MAWANNVTISTFKIISPSMQLASCMRHYMGPVDWNSASLPDRVQNNVSLLLPAQYPRRYGVGDVNESKIP